ncbi:uncharacterized protein [Hyperolius riggenbachi]|uniref:uncharacterized protein n=1 Tax=Hyperolius riggenbachi TaxID=752182 RepID=UPI0035A26C5A
MKAFHFLHLLVLLLHSSCYRSWALMLVQPPAVAAVVGSNVTLSCHLQLGEESLKRVVPYWYGHGRNETKKQYIHPADPANTIEKLSVYVISSSHETDMSVVVTDIRLPNTNTYFCETSLILGSGDRIITGNGTYLLVHEPLEVDHNGADITCRTEIQEVQHVTLLWQFDGTDFRDGDHTWGNNPTGYWISNRFLNWTSQCQATENVTISCCLQYMGRTLVTESVEVPCTAPRDPPSPLHLYSLIFGCNFLILAIILLVWIRRRRRSRRRGASTAPYSNLPSKGRKGVAM